MNQSFPEPNHCQPVLSVNDTRLRIFGPPVLFLVGTLFFRLNWYIELSRHVLVESDLIALGAGYTCWNLTRWVVLQLQHRYPGLTHTRRRLLWMALLMPVLVNVAWYIRHVFHVLLNHPGYNLVSLPEYAYALGIQIFYHSVYFVIYEGSYVMRAWQQAYRQNEQLKKNKLQHQLDTLKSQINPHFLFNSLNSLSALIQESPRTAETFVDELSSVYRYLLRTNGTSGTPEQDQSLTTLEKEIEFIRSYFSLLKTRYGDGVNLNIQVSEQQADYKLPPLTLQLLLENAVKHNLILSEQPLVVNIEAKDQQLIIRNTLQRKKVPVLSNNVGLASIAKKYQLLSGKSIDVREADGQFIVTLPLLQNYPETGIAL